MRLVLVRHGETEHNRQHLVLGRADPPLSDLGLRQAEAAGREILERYKVSAIYASPLLRAQKTAQAIGELLGVSCTTEEDLRELDVGDIEGLTAGEVAEQHRDFLTAWQGENGSQVRLPGGSESLADVQERGWQAVERIRGEQEADATVVAVSHSMVLHAIVCKVLSMPLSGWRRFDLALASITAVDFRPNRTIVTGINETCHLDSLAQQRGLPPGGA